MYIEMFLKEAEIIFMKINVTFKKHEEVLQYDPNDAPNELDTNKDWKS